MPARAEARLAAAEAVIAAVPDPLILIDRQRRIVRTNAAAAEFIGLVPEPRDLAAALRNPLVLAAADAVLRGEPARIVEFALSVPVERVLRAHLARIADGRRWPDARRRGGDPDPARRHRAEAQPSRCAPISSPMPGTS